MGHDTGAACACATGHRPAVLEYQTHHVHPLALGGPDTPENRIALCPTAHVNVHELMRVMFRAGRLLTHYELTLIEDRPVSRYAAALARRGYLLTTGQGA